MEKTDSELVDDCCPLHPDRKIEIVEEENYFFKFSAFQKELIDLYEKNPEFVVPKHRFNEIKNKSLDVLNKDISGNSSGR